MTAIEEELEFLLRSDNRTELLLALDGTEAPDRYDLEAEIDASRRTVTRTIDALLDRGYLEEGDDGYVLTAFGAALADAYREYREAASVAEQFRPFLEHVDADAFDLDPTLLDGADLTVASETAPFTILNRTLELRAEATRVRELAPAVEKRSVEQLAERIRDGEELDVEVILPSETFETAASNGAFSDDHHTVQESDAVDFHVVPGQPSLFVGVMDETATVGAAVDGEPQALIESTHAKVRKWAESKLDDYRRAGMPLSER